MLRRIAHVLIPLLCLYHMAAIGLYLVPFDDVHDTLRQPVAAGKRWTTPYVQLTSQWQWWNIFSPNPQRRVTSMRIEQKQGDRWVTVISLSRWDLPWWRRSKELKLLSRIEDDWNGLTPAYLQEWCEQAQLSGDMRLMRKMFVIPLDHEVRRTGGWKNWKPIYEEAVVGSTTCTQS